MNGTLYGVGVGPGDPELLTLAAVRVIESCSVIATPDSGSGEQIALNIAEKYVNDKKILHCDMPMTKDKNLLNAAHKKTASRLAEYLKKGEDIAFLMLGDPSIYSTYMYIHRLVLDMGYDAKMVAGVPSFCAVAAALNMPLCEGGEPLHIIPASYGDISGALMLQGSKVLMKSGKNLKQALDLLEKKGLTEASALVTRCGMNDEKIIDNLENWDGEADYFTLIIVKEKNG